MSVLRFLIVSCLLACLPACSEVNETARATVADARVQSGEAQATTDRVCETVKAVATGFGEQSVERFAQSNLDIAIDKAKDALMSKGAKRFTLSERSVQCSGYIDFGGSIGREHKCDARAILCTKT